MTSQPPITITTPTATAITQGSQRLVPPVPGGTVVGTAVGAMLGSLVGVGGSVAVAVGVGLGVAEATIRVTTTTTAVVAGGGTTVAGEPTGVTVGPRDGVVLGSPPEGLGVAVLTGRPVAVDARVGVLTGRLVGLPVF